MMMRQLPLLARCASRPLRDRRGIAAVEFALVAPALFLMVCAAFELGHIMYARAVLEGAVTQAARVASASLETSETARRKVMLDYVKDSMAVFTTAKGKSISIDVKVYRDFSTAYPENYTDVNKNGAYDLGEPYTDRNKNGKWDPATPIPSIMGGPGDVVSYTAEFPKEILFGFLSGELGLGKSVDLSATTVVRNENMVKKST